MGAFAENPLCLNHAQTLHRRLRFERFNWSESMYFIFAIVHDLNLKDYWRTGVKD